MKNRILWLPGMSDTRVIAAAIDENEELPRYFRIDASPYGSADKSLISIAHKNLDARSLVSHLATMGFYLYYNTGADNRFIRHDRIPYHWPAVKDGEYSWSNEGVVYKLELPTVGPVESLVVVFSPVNSKPRLSRYFWQSFAKLGKYVPRGTAILRIGDVGGVKGAFYLDTVHRPDNAGAISRLISATVSDLGIDDDLVVLYGASKGGTGALYHALVGGWRIVAVDPIVSDVWWLFTNGSGCVI